MNTTLSRWKLFFTAILLMLLFLALHACTASHGKATNAPTTEPAQATFGSPDSAAQALVDAVQANNLPLLSQILGPGSDQIISSGDAVADQQNRRNFVDEYDEKHQLDANSDGSETLCVGSDDWPLPIPIVPVADRWRFDSQAGLNEMLNRRIGKNELSTIQVCLAIVDAQRDYAERDMGGGDLPEYAQKFLSDPGTTDGLYWPVAKGEPQSPLGPLVADAAEEGYAMTNPPPQAYHGYFYRILKSQGPNAPGGAMDYVVNGQMIGGFAVVAWPAQYGNSGVVTFLVSYEGVVYQKDLGPDTNSIALAMSSYDPDSSWKPAENPQ